MDNKYIGVRDYKGSTNLGDIWEKQPNGLWKCTNNPRKKNMSLSEEQIKSDIKKGFLKQHI